MHGEAVASASVDGSRGRTLASQFFDTFSLASLRPGSTLAIAHARARGGPSSHTQALAHARVTTYGG